ncbi:MAG: ATP synthase F1 subunit delta, partial [Rickettsiales bacterium]|nr:ATP synthase F1 subunit delta [Rickettsiales bacterium]
ELSDFISNQAISKKLVAKTILEVCTNLNISKNIADFISLVVASRRGGLLKEITIQFENLINKSSGKSKAIITSTKKLDEKSLGNITNILSQKLNKNIIAENIVDRSILGGLKIQIGSTLIDDSVSEKLNKLKKVLSN